MVQSVFRVLAILGALLLSGCAADQLRGFENTYYAYNVPQSLLDRITLELRANGLANARIMRDNVGRVRLAGSYQNEDEVDRAFIIVQSIVGLKSTSPFYPADIKQTRWDAMAGKALAARTKPVRAAGAPARKLALVIGINTFKDSKHLTPIQGEDDARVANAVAAKAGYEVTALLGRDATKARIEAALEDVEAKLGPNDSLFVYISSHGSLPLPTSAGGDARKMSIIAWDSGDAQLGRGLPLELKVHKTAVSDVLVQRLAQKPTRNTRMIIDTCYSGEMLKGIPDESSAYILKNNGGQPERAGIALSSWTNPAFTSKGIRLSDDASAPSGAERASGVAPAMIANDRAYSIFTATSEGESSWGPGGGSSFELSPGRTLNGSFFTQAFFAYLDDEGGQIEPAFAAAKAFTQRMGKIATEGKGHQVPRQYSTPSSDRKNL